MVYEQFVRTLRTKLVLARAMHTQTGKSRESLRKSVDVLTQKLHTCPQYDHYMDKVSAASDGLY